MSDIEKLSVLIETQFNDRGAKAAGKAVDGLGSSLDEAAGKASSSAKTSEGAFSKLRNAITRTSSEAKKGAEFELKASDSGMDGISSAIKGARADAARGADFELRASGGVGSLTREMQSVRAEASKGATYQVDTGNSESQLSGLKDSMKEVASIAGGVALGDMAGGGVEGLSQNLQDSARSAGMLQAQLGVTSQQAKNLKGVGLDVYTSNWGDSMGDVTNAIGTVQRSMGHLGASKSEIRDITENAFILRDAFGYDVTESIEAARVMTDTFGISSKRAFDLMAAGSQSAAGSSGDLLEVISEYGPNFKNLGLSASDSLALLNAGMENGAWNADKLADGLREFSVRATDGSKTTAEGFKLAGLEAGDMAAKIAEGGPVAEKAFQQTLDAIASIEDPLKRQKAGVALFGSMWEDQGGKAYLSMRNVEGGLNDVDGATKRAGDGLSDNFGSKLAGITRQAQVFVTETLGISGGLGEVAEVGGNAGFAIGGFALAASSGAPLIAKGATSAWGLAAAGWAAYAPLIALAGVGLIAVGIAYTFDYEGFNEARKKAKEEGQWAGAQYAEGVLAGLETVPVLNQVSEWIGDGVDALTKNAPEVTLWDVLTGENKASENKISSRLLAAYNEVSGLLDGIEPKTSLWDVLSGRGKVSETPFLGGLMSAYDSSTAWMASLKPETSLWDVLTDRKKASEHSLLEPLATAYTSATEWMASLKPEVSLWDAITGQGKVSETPFLGGLMAAYSGATEWMAELAPETSLWDVLTGKGKAEDNPILGRIQSSYTGASEFIAGLKPETSLWDVLTGRGDSENSTFLTNLNTTWTTAKDTVVARAGEMGEGAGSYLAQLKEGAIARFTETKDGGIALVSELRDGGISGAAQMSAGVIERSLGMKEGTLANFLATKTGGVDLTEQMKTGVVTLIENLKSGTMSVLDTMPPGVRGIFEAVGDAMLNPMETARDALQGVWNSILDGISKVLKAVGMDKLAGDVAGAKWATGGTTQGGRPQTGAFATGGVVGVSSFAEGGKGGMGTGAARPRLHLWNEQQGPEAYIVKNRPTSEQLPYLSTAANWHGYKLSKEQSKTHDHLQPYRGAPGYSEARRAAQIRSAGLTAFKGGGTIDVGSLEPNTSYPWQTNVGKAVTAFYEVGVNDVTTYEGHSPSMDLATDVWVGGSTYGQVPSDDSKFMGFANWVVGNMGGLGAEYVIAKQQINMGGGWSMMEDRGSMTQNHMDHVHVSFIPGAGGGTVGATLGEFASPGGGSGAGGGVVRSLWDIAGSRIWDASVGKVWDRFKSSLPNMVLAQAIGGAGDMVLEGIKDKIIAESGTTTTGGSLPGGNSPSGLTIGEALSKGGWPDDLLVEGSSTIWHESRGIADAQNPSGASGLMQIMPATAEGVGADPSKLFDPIYNTTVGKKVYDQAGGWGPWVGAGQGGDYRNEPVTGYSLGGRIPGAPGKPVTIRGHAGEGIFRRDAVDSLDRLASSVTLWSQRTGRNAAVDADSLLSESRDELIEEVRLLRKKLDKVGLSDDTKDAIERGARQRAREEIVGTAGRAAFSMHSQEDEHDYSLKGGI